MGKMNLQFATKINGTEETGIIDLSTTPPELICLCTKENATQIIRWKNESIKHRELSDKIGSFYEEDSESNLIDIGEAAASHYGYL